MCRTLILPMMVVLALAAAVSRSPAVELTAKTSPQGVVVKIDGEMFTEYLTRSGAKPILWPVLGPTGKPMTRAYPMGEAPNEKKDHVHQRSLWFTHGSVNGVDFWAEGKKSGTIVHRRFVKVASGPEAVVVAENDWLGPDGKKVCEDQRRLGFGAGENARWIDFDITIKASEGPVKFGDTKEGTFGIRMAETMRVDAPGKGKIVNCEGQTNQAAWGRKAAWVDYWGPVDGQTVGIAVLNHPKSFRFPTHWHVRTYGLFAANPFGLHDFPGGEKLDGSHVVPAGESISFCYRVLLHKGDDKEGQVGEAFQAYSALAK